MENTKPKLTRAESNQRIRQAIDAIQKGDLQTLSSLVHTRAQANWLEPDRQGMALLSYAVESKHPEIVKWLLEKGADPNTLFLGCRLVKLGAGDGYAEGHYRSPLRSAIGLEQVDSIALLLEHGADLELPVSEDYTHGGETCEDLLIRFGLEKKVNVRREAIQIAKTTSTPATKHTAGKPRL